MRRLALLSLIPTLLLAGTAQAAPTLEEFPPVPTANAGIQDIVQGRDGNMWFTERNANMIGRISGTTPGATTEFPLAGGATSPDLIVVGPDGALWYTQSNSVGRMPPPTRQGFRRSAGLGIIQAAASRSGRTEPAGSPDAGGNQATGSRRPATAASVRSAPARRLRARHPARPGRQHVGRIFSAPGHQAGHARITTMPHRRSSFASCLGFPARLARRIDVTAAAGTARSSRLASPPTGNSSTRGST